MFSSTQRHTVADCRVEKRPKFIQCAAEKLLERLAMFVSNGAAATRQSIKARPNRQTSSPSSSIGANEKCFCQCFFFLFFVFLFFFLAYKTESLLSKKATTATTTTKWISWFLPFSLSRCVSPIAGGTKREFKGRPAEIRVSIVGRHLFPTRLYRFIRINLDARRAPARGT